MVRTVPLPLSSTFNLSNSVAGPWLTPIYHRNINHPNGGLEPHPLVPPTHATAVSNGSPLESSGADPKTVSDTGISLHASHEEPIGASTESERDPTNADTAVSLQPLINPSNTHIPLAQYYAPSSPGTMHQQEPQHPTTSYPIPCAPSPPHTILGVKRRRASTPGDANGAVGCASNAVANDSFTHQMKGNEHGSPVKRRRVITHQPDLDYRWVQEGGYKGSSQPVHRKPSFPSIPTSQLQNEDSDNERSQVIELLSQKIEQGESEDEEGSTENILAGLIESRHALPTLAAVKTRENSKKRAKPEAVTRTSIQKGPIILSLNPNKFSDGLRAEVSQKDAGEDLANRDPESTADISVKSTRFSVDDTVEKKVSRVFRKTPMKPKVLRKAEDISAAEDEVEVKPLSLPKKKRAIGAQARKRKAAQSTGKPELVDVSPGNELPSISANRPEAASRPERGKSSPTRPEAPTPPKGPVRRSTRVRK